MFQGRIPPSPEVFGRFGVNVQNARKITWAPLFDYTTYPAAGIAALQFFSQPIGQGTTSHPGGAGPKTIADTNLETAGLLPYPQSFFCIVPELELLPGILPGRTGAIADTGQFVNDLYTIARSGTLRLKIGDQEWTIDSPLGRFPTTVRLHTESALADSTTAGAAQGSQISYASLGGSPYEITPLYIPSTQKFSVRLEWPNVQALPSGQPARIGVRLNGWLIQLAQ